MAPGSIINLNELRRTCMSCSLQQLCLVATMNRSELEQLDRIVKHRRPLTRGERLYQQGDPLSSLYVSRSGSFKTVSTDVDGNSQVIGLHLAGELMGLDGMGRGQHQCDAVALQPATVCELPLDRLETLLAEFPAMQQQLMRVVGRGRDQDQSHLEMLGRRQADDRVLLFLHSLRERYRSLELDPDQIALPMSREDIASYLGLVIETVSRSLGRLQDEGIIAVQGRQVRIVDAARLTEQVHANEPQRRRG